MNIWNVSTPYEVVDSMTMTAILLHNTEASKAIISNMEYTVSVEDKCDNVLQDVSKTREFPDVSSDKMSNKENLVEEFCLSTIQDIEVDKSI